MENYFRTVQETGNPRLRYLDLGVNFKQDWFPLEPFFLASMWLSSRFLSLSFPKLQHFCCCFHFQAYKNIIVIRARPTLMASFKPSYVLGSAIQLHYVLLKLGFQYVIQYVNGDSVAPCNVYIALHNGMFITCVWAISLPYKQRSCVHSVM